MVTIRPLSTDETSSVFPRRGSVDITEYIDALRPINPGEAGEVELNGHTPRALKRRMGMAAKELGCSLKWARIDDEDVMVFQVRHSPVARAPRNKK